MRGSETASAGIQIDVTVITREIDGKRVEVPYCDHSCWSENYKCPAAKSQQAGFVVSHHAPVHLLVQGIRNVADSLRHITSSDGPIEVNLFGGNPALHSGILDVISNLSASRFPVCLSMPGRKFISIPNFAYQVTEAGTKTVALSADDFLSPEHVDRLVALPIDALCHQWRQVPYHQFQRKKAIQAIYAARKLQRVPYSPAVCFNLVIHPSNVFMLKALIRRLAHHFPESLINPYPAQTAFCGGASPFTVAQIGKIGEFVDTMLEGTLPQVVHRPHYWTLLKAVYELYWSDFRALSAAVCGKGVWNCCFAGNRYIQIGRRSANQGSQQYPGGYLNCFWNPSGYIDRGNQVWDPTYLDGLVLNYGSPDCPGCLMPQLLFDEENMVKGLSEEILSVYQVLRR